MTARAKETQPVRGWSLIIDALAALGRAEIARREIQAQQFGGKQSNADRANAGQPGDDKAEPIVGRSA